MSRSSPGSRPRARLAQGAIRTDFILSAEIIAITLGIVAAAPFGTRLMVLAAVAVAATMTVGIVAGGIAVAVVAVVGRLRAGAR